ncbi:unnamed protein product [Staurois parvus]|uniref:Uncharacterized protein n=1 Tax=Staurois parvus TaxID=386267 RepID=A0ABN9H205_9NEOB|nr:unnamed protein product [Staurois parvus]
MRGDLASLEEMEAITTRSSVRLNYLDTQYINTKLLAHFTNKNFDEATSMIESLCIEKNPQLPLYYLLIRLMQNNMSEAIEKASIVLERLSNQFSVYHPVTDLFFAYLKLRKVEEANHLLQRCSAILEQVEFLCQHVSNRAYGGQKQHVCR